MKKEKKEKKIKKEKKVKNGKSNRFSGFIKLMLSNRTQTFILAAMLIAIFVFINLAVQEIDLAQIDFTENQVYTLTDTSKKAIQDVNQDVKMYFYGFSERDTRIDLAKQYGRANSKISYEILTNESNPTKVAEYELTDGYQIVIVETADNHQLINASTEFVTYDYTTYATIDTTEQTLTNAILNLTMENKPKVYLLQGHNEYTENDLVVLQTYIKNEVYEFASINLVTVDSVPEDCSVLVIMDPTSDFLDSDVEKIQAYINRGGDIFFAKDLEQTAPNYPNIQKILDMYGVAVENGCVLEADSTKVAANFPTAFIPAVDPSHDITKEIYTDGQLLLYSAGRLKIKDEETLASMNVTETDLITSSEESYFISDLTGSIQVSNGEQGQSVIGAYFVKSLSENKEALEEETDSNTSKLVIVANAQFVSSKALSNLSQNTPLALYGQNKDFILNTLAYMSKRDNLISVRKDTQTTTYTPTEQEDLAVRIIIFAVPITIIVAGCLVWRHRKRKK